jgi:rhodanese-related sulfurtransferase
VFDVRKEGEFLSAHIDKAHFTSLDNLNNHLEEFPENESFYVHCAGGYRSVIAASILKSRGIHNLIDVAGGMAAIRKTDITLVENACPSTLK